MLKAAKRTRIPEEIVSQVLKLVRDGTLKPGDRLPPERELAQQLNVSRASVREAMRLMDMQGLVIIRPGSGTFITEDTVEVIVQAFSSLLSGPASAASDIFEMRLILEPQVVSLAAERTSDADVRRMEEILRQQEEDIANGGTGVEFDSEFHFAIAQATNNSALIAVTQAISDLLSQSRDSTLLSPERSNQSLESHRRILETIKNRQSKSAEVAMHQHIADIDRRVHNLSSHKDLEDRVVGL